MIKVLRRLPSLWNMRAGQPDAIRLRSLGNAIAVLSDDTLDALRTDLTIDTFRAKELVELVRDETQRRGRAGETL